MEKEAETPALAGGTEDTMDAKHAERREGFSGVHLKDEIFSGTVDATLKVIVFF